MIERRAHLRRTQFQQTMDSLPFQVFQMRFDARRQIKTVQSTLQSPCHMRSRFARRCRQRDTGQLRTVITNQAQKLCDGCRLTCTRPAGNQHKVLQQGQSRSIPLLFAVFSIKPVAQAF